MVLSAGAAVYAWRHAERLWKQVKESREEPCPQEDTNESLSLDVTYEADGPFQVEMWVRGSPGLPLRTTGKRK